MKTHPTPIEGLVLLEPKVFGDERGFFLESYSKRTFEELGLSADFVQDNHARSQDKGVLRGLHFQAPPFQQTKLIRCLKGAILDVVVDVRHCSPTFGNSYSVELTAENFLQLWVPPGMAHGYVTLVEDCEVAYKVDQFYAPQSEGGLLWNDPALGIDWPVEDPVIAERDARWPTLDVLDSPFHSS